VAARGDVRRLARAQLHKAGRDLDTPVNMVGALLKCCLSQFWKMIVAKPRHVIALKFFDICC
jgi:hypothetical protein